MFQNIIGFIKGLIGKMFKRDDLKKVIGRDIQLSTTMLDKIAYWSNMLSGKAEWVGDNVKSLRIEQGICKELANISLNEMTATITDEKLDEIFKYSTRELNENLQKGLGLGSFIIKPLGENKAEYVTPDRFVPIEFDNRGRLTHVAFIDTKKVGNDYYRRFEFHELTDNGLLIYNKAYFSTSESEIGRPTALTSIPEWAKLPEQPLLYAINRPDFGYYRNPIPNTIDGSFNGVSVFDSAIDLIKSTDTQFGRLEWEFESGERAIHVPRTALKKDGTVEKLNRRLYRAIEVEKSKDEELFEVRNNFV